MAVPLIDVRAHRSRIGPEIDRRIAAVVDHGAWIMGPEVRELEEALSRYVGGGVQAIGCANGTDALVLALQALDVGAGQVVICPSFTFVATAEAVAAVGAVPAFADVRSSDFALDPSSVASVARRIAGSGGTVAGIIAVDLFGHPADVPALREVAADHGAWIIADAAQSFGAATTAGRVGSLADITTTSFFPAKPLGCYGDGGALFTSDDELAATIRSLQIHGKGDDKYHNVRIGQNSRLDTIQAAILLPRLAILDDELDARQVVADRYQHRLADLVTVPTVAPGVRSAWAQYTVLVDDRAALQEVLDDHEVSSMVYYPVPLHRQPAYAAFHDGSALPISDWLSEHVLSLPMHPYLSEPDQEQVIRAVAAGATAHPMAEVG